MILAKEIISKRRGDAEDLSFEKKVIKVHKALKVMEKQKMAEPKYSESLQELVVYFHSLNNEGESKSLSRLSKLDLDSSFTGIGSAFNIFQAAAKEDGLEFDDMKDKN